MTEFDAADPKSQLELFLLSGMRNTAEVERAMVNLGVTSDDVERARNVVMAAKTGDLPVHPLSFFLPLIEPDGEETVASSKFGDRRRRLTFESWPGLMYTYLLRPDGIATCPEFASTASGRPALKPTVVALQPWAVTRADVERWFGPPSMVDEWEFDAGLNYNLEPGEGAEAVPHRLDFDHSLLQIVRRI